MLPLASSDIDAMGRRHLGRFRKSPRYGDDTVTDQGHAEPTVVDQAIASVPPVETPPPAPAPTATVDVDELELQQAKAEAEAEVAAAAQTATEKPVTDGTAPPTPPAETPPKDQAAAAPAETPTIPKPRFDEVNGRLSKAEREAAYWRGVAEARQAPASGTAAPAAPPQTPAQQLKGIDDAIDALAAKFDEGEITMKDYKAQERVLEAKRSEITRAPAPKPDSGASDLYLASLTAQIETQHPWVKEFEAVGTDADWSYFRNLAIGSLAERGVDASAGDMGKYELRKEIGVLMDQYGPALLKDRLVKAGRPIPGQATPTPQAPAMSAEAKARAAKLATAAGAPPNLAAMTGGAGDGAGQFTPAQIENMGEEEIAALPDAVRRKYLGIAA